jgi:two-component system, OmpR family, KDP operon response regulator KdpE
MHGSLVSAKRILVIEDDRPIRDFVSALLDDEGYNVAVSSTSQTTLAIATSLDPDLIILNVHAPFYPEYKFLREYQNIPGRRAPVIGMGTRSTTDPQIETQRYGIASFLQMPFEIDHLIAQVQRLLSPLPENKLLSTTAN